MVKKKIDNRIRIMIENGVKSGHRTLFVIIGDKGRDQVFLKKKNGFRKINFFQLFDDLGSNSL